MSLDEIVAPWTRKHDDPSAPLIASARTTHPASLQELIELCANRAPTDHLTAAGSHWALSDAAIADDVFVETHAAASFVPATLFQAMGRTLFDVVPGCLSAGFVESMANMKQPAYDANNFETNAGFYLVHFETGKRIYQLYAELDQGDDNNAASLAVLLKDAQNNPTYLGPWAISDSRGCRRANGLRCVDNRHTRRGLHNAPDRRCGDGAASRGGRRPALLDRAGVQLFSTCS